MRSVSFTACQLRGAPDLSPVERVSFPPFLCAHTFVSCRPAPAGAAKEADICQRGFLASRSPLLPFSLTPAHTYSLHIAEWPAHSSLRARTFSAPNGCCWLAAVRVRQQAHGERRRKERNSLHAPESIRLFFNVRDTWRRSNCATVMKVGPKVEWAFR